MLEPMARAMGWPNKDIGLSDVFDLARDTRGWGSLNHPEWGQFKLAKTSPLISTSGLHALIATYYAGKGTRVGTEIAPDTITVSGLTTWSAGTMSGTGSTVAQGGLALISGGGILDQRSLINAGVATQSGNFVLFGSNYQDVFAFLVLILVLVFRPSGLLGERVGDRA